MLAHSGYGRYEISAYSQKGQECRHNLNYWTFGDYLGIGAGAHGKISTNEVVRTQKHRQPHDYLNTNKPFLARQQKLLNSDLAFEFMLNATRLEGKISKSLLQQRTGITLADIDDKFQLAKDLGFIVDNENYWQVTSHGRRFTNNLQGVFLG